MATGWLVVTMQFSNRSSRRGRLLLIVFVVSVPARDLTAPPIPEQLLTRIQGIDGVLRVDECARE